MDQAVVLPSRGTQAGELSRQDCQRNAESWEGLTKDQHTQGTRQWEGRSAQKDLKVLADNRLTISQPGTGVPRVGNSILGCRINSIEGSDPFPLLELSTGELHPVLGLHKYKKHGTTESRIGPQTWRN